MCDVVLQKSQFVGRNIKDIVNEVNIRSPYLKYAHNIYSQAGDNGIIKSEISVKMRNIFIGFILFGR